MLEGRDGRAAVRASLDAHAHLDGGRRREMGGHPMVLRANELQLTRGESIRDTALVFSRHAAVIGLRTSSEERLRELAALRRGPGGEHALARPSPAAGARRPADDARGVRRPRGPRARLRRRRQQRRALAGDRRHARRRRGARGGAARLPARRAARRGADRRPGGGRRRRRRPLHRRLGLDGRRRGRGRRAPRGARALPPRRRAARPRRARRDRAALPARAPRRGDHRGGPLRRRASASGTRPRTAATRRRRCSSCSLGRVRRPCHKHASRAARRPLHRAPEVGALPRIRACASS